MRVGVVGPSRTAEGTGPFVIDFLRRAGAEVVAVAGSTFESSVRAAARLPPPMPVPLRNAAELMSSGGIDAVAICSPIQYHEEQLWCALSAGLHAFCEKPLVWSEDGTAAARVAQLAEGFAARKLVLHQNTQWTCVLDELRQWVEVPARQSFAMRMSPPCVGLSMFRDSMSHPLSILAALGATGRVSGVTAAFESETLLRIGFAVERRVDTPLDVTIELATARTQPRSCSMVFDDRTTIDRVVTSMAPYSQALDIDGRRYPLSDPLQGSVHKFLARAAAGEVEEDPGLHAEFQMMDALWPHVAASSARILR